MDRPHFRKMAEALANRLKAIMIIIGSCETEAFDAEGKYIEKV